MKTIALAWRYLWSRPLPAALNLLLLALGLATLVLVLQVRAQLDRAFQRDLAGIDLVVGAKGSPLQLILAGVFHLDVPPGNVPLAEVRALQRNPAVARLIPLSLGDSLQGFRIVGTTAEYPALYQAALAAGDWWRAPMQAVLGARVAAQTGLAPGQAFAGSHGLAAGGHAHEGQPYRVTGVLQPCGCVLDRLVLTATESVWQVHDQMHAGAQPLDEDERAALEAERDVTLALIQYRSPLAAVAFPRYINASTPLQAAAPALEITRLLRMVGVGTEVLQGFGLVMLLSAGLSVFMALWNAVREREADLAMLRMLGAPPWRVAALLLAEAAWLALLASALGLALGLGLTGLLGQLLAQQQSVAIGLTPLAPELLALPALALALGVLASLPSVWRAYRVDVLRLLDNRG